MESTDAGAGSPAGSSTSLRLHHLNCGTMCPHGQRLLSGQGGWLAPARLVCHVLLIEAPDGLILVDTGLGSGDVEHPAAGQGWLLHCGDAYFHHREVATPPSCPPGLRVFQNLVQADGKLRRQNQERLRELAHSRPSEVTLICSHDPHELEANFGLDLD